MQPQLDQIALTKEEKLNALFDQLIADGYKLEKDNVFRDGRIRQRKIISYELTRAGYAKDSNDAFNRILNSERYHQYANNIPNIKEAIKIIHSCDGLAIWAHPFGVTRGGKLTENQVEELSKNMLDYKIDAIEVYYQKYTAESIKFLENLAIKMNLSKSIGTDYHGYEPRNRLRFDVDGITPDADVYKVIKCRHITCNHS